MKNKFQSVNDNIAIIVNQINAEFLGVGTID